MSKIKLGQKVRDEVTGLEGIAVCKTEWLHGCIRVGVQPPVDKDGKPTDIFNVDEPQLVVVKPAKPQKEKKRTFGGRPSATRHTDPTR